MAHSQLQQLWHWLTFSRVMWLALVLRVGMLAFGEWQDATMAVKYTDIDYQVFTDAARFITVGESPYARATYRYTPLLAMLLTPNVLLWSGFGKLLFIASDLLAGLLLYRLLRLRSVTAQRATQLSALWLLNPFVATISTRGNAESLLATAVLATLYFLALRRSGTAAVVFGLAVQLKFYPIIYALPFWCLLDDAYMGHPTRPHARSLGQRVRAFLLSWPRIRFGLIAAGVFGGLSLLMYALYGWDYLEHTYLYHVTRRDHRHNFSVWFYHMYLSAYDDMGSGAPQLLAFLPQLIPVVVLGAAFAKDPAFALFAQTFAFVVFNKVCTSQYFMWYLCLLPLVLASTRLQFRWRGLALIVGWVVPQAAWLYFAFQLEFLGQNTFFAIWVSCLLFFLASIWVLVVLVQQHHYSPWFIHGQLQPIESRRPHQH